ncbi:MAG: ABC transporter permease, partial [Pirellulales bacterium]
MLLEPAVERAVLTALGSEKGLGREADGATEGRGEERKGHGGAVRREGDSAQEVLTYLANYISAGADDRGKIPYSTVAALEVRTQPPLGPFKTVDGETIKEIEEDEIVLNSWAAEDLARQGVALEAGDAIKLTYFEPDSTHGEVREATATFRLKAVVALEDAAADRALTPELKGVTDEESLADWNPPFPYDPQRVRSTPPNDQDEKYWDEYGATPKAFISLEAGRRLWASRFGRTTSLRIPAGAGVDEAQLVDRIEAELARNAATVGFAARPVKEEGLAAAAGTTAFDMLFLYFSFFIIAAAVMLVALLFRLGLEQRASEIGLLTAVGLRPGQVRGLLLGEGLVVAATAGVAGAATGVGYAWLMLAGLRAPGWWLSAVSTPFLRLYVTPASLLIGYASGVLVSVGAIGWGIWQMRRVSVRRLLNNQAEELQPAAGGRPRRRARLSRTVAGGAFALAVAAAAGAMWLREEARAGAFFGSGALVLAALLTMVWSRLKEPDTAALVSEGGWAVARLAARNGARHPGRSTLTIGLVAAASFLIVAISAFRLDPPEAIHEKNSGSGGFALLAQSAQPIYHDLDSEDGRLELGFSQADSQELAKTRTISLRVRPGDDASCLNLYQPSQPRVLGVPQRLIERGGFAWKETAASSAAERNNP